MTYKSQKKNLLAKYRKSDIIKQRGSLEKSMVLGDGCLNTLSPTNSQSATNTLSVAAFFMYVAYTLPRVYFSYNLYYSYFFLFSKEKI